jgi:sigma-B regulation protein RsbU (phosphoserine phosphatase)
MPLGLRGTGEVFGEMALIEERPRFATVRALEPTQLLEIPEHEMRSALAQEPDLLFRTVRTLSTRLREADLQMIADLQAKNEELARAYRELKEAQAGLLEKERLERELELAREIQQGILPRAFPRAPGFSCAARSRPARFVGGDFYDVIPLADRRIGLVMADVSDKGMPAAMFMALTRSLIRAEAQRMLSPERTLCMVNQLLLEMSEPAMFVTIFYGVLDPSEGSLCYVRAGHDYPVHVRSETRDGDFLTGFGTVIGFMAEVELQEVHLDLGSGDLLALYTDGITQASSKAGEFFGARRLRDSLCAAREKTAQEVCDSIFAQVDLFQKGIPQHDDMALLIVKWEAQG